MRRLFPLFLTLLMLVSMLVPSVSAQEDSRTFTLTDRISFTYSTQVAPDATYRLVPATHEIETPTGPVPEYTEIAFQTFANEWTNTGQYIYVYPVITFPTDPNTPFAQELANLQAVLAARPAVPAGNLPMLPVVTANQYFRAQVQYLDFATGSGIRYITAAGFDVSPITNQSLFYSFQGLTADGAYYIVGMFPIKSPVLPDVPESMDADQYNQFASTFDAYLVGLVDQLNVQTPESFSTNLTLLDALFASVQTTAPAATIVTPVGAAGDATFDNVHFTYDPTLASRLEVDVIAPFTDNEGMTMYGSLPGSTVFSFYDYPVTRFYGQPEIRIFPVDTFPGANSITDQVLVQLQQFLASRPALTSDTGQVVPALQIPVLPIVNAAQVFVVKPQYLDFQNGSGVRFVTYYAQAPSPLFNNGTVFYTYQGLTADGKYVITAQFPVYTPVLPDVIDFNTFDFEGFMATYESYMTETTAALDASTYTPDLSLLDALIQSISVGQ
ncbi:MAG TPA: hypothetical protein VHP83_23145 [Aggregatilineaceae bacterium]|nr:hypothetical protein [Aggregatilineaceae bacterium]